MKTKPSSKVLFLGLYGFIFADILLKIGLYESENTPFAFLTFGLEIVFRFIIFYFNLINLAFYGILNRFRSSNYKKKTLIISFGTSFLISLILFIIRIVIYGGRG